MALTIGAASLVTTAEARHRHHRHHNDGSAAAAAIFGLAAGAIFGSALSQPRYPRYYYEPAPVYVAPPPPRAYYYEPAPVYHARPAPWTAEWYDYCRARYISFDDQTGLFYGYDGRYHFCR
jgi:hypothetical protein